MPQRGVRVAVVVVRRHGTPRTSIIRLLLRVVRGTVPCRVVAMLRFAAVVIVRIGVPLLGGRVVPLHRRPGAVRVAPLIICGLPRVMLAEVAGPILKVLCLRLVVILRRLAVVVHPVVLLHPLLPQDLHLLLRLLQAPLGKLLQLRFTSCRLGLLLRLRFLVLALQVAVVPVLDAPHGHALLRALVHLLVDGVQVVVVAHGVKLAGGHHHLHVTWVEAASRSFHHVFFWVFMLLLFTVPGDALRHPRRHGLRLRLAPGLAVVHILRRAPRGTGRRAQVSALLVLRLRCVVCQRCWGGAILRRRLQIESVERDCLATSAGSGLAGG
mmetsp:Transcript_7583/g.19227  ORF Transcript_7583/g.19227 Transcript_7583/m.19227 type:complete len:325 (+) Transcript_7583:1786-2760(+)